MTADERDPQLQALFAAQAEELPAEPFTANIVAEVNRHRRRAIVWRVLIALTLASTHCVLSVAHLSPAYFTNWYATTVTAPVSNGTVTMPTSVIMNWKGERVILAGALALGTMSILGITSIPSVMSQLNWKQWDFLHTGLGYACLLVSAAHVGMKRAPDWPGKSFADIAKGMVTDSML